MDFENQVFPTVDPNAAVMPTVDPNAAVMPTIDPNAVVMPTVDPNIAAVPTVDPTVVATPDATAVANPGDIQSIITNTNAVPIAPIAPASPVAPVVPESIDLDAIFQAQYEAEMARQAQIQLEQQQALLALQAAQMQSILNANQLGIASIAQTDVAASMVQQPVAQDINQFIAQTANTIPTALPNQTFIPSNIPQTGIIKNYTNYKYFYGKWSKGSAQRQLSEVWNAAGRTSDRGIATLNNRYLVAVSPKFGKVGDNIDVCLDNGVVIPCTIADAKGKDAKSQWGHTFKGGAVDVIEWESMGGQSVINTDGWKGHKVDSIITYPA